MAKKKSTKTTKRKLLPRRSRLNRNRFIFAKLKFVYKKKRVSSKSSVNQPLTDADKVASLFKDLQNETKEKLIAISLDAQLKIITFEVVSIGSVSSVAARPFEMLRTAIVVNAYGLILVHNHPSGNPTPSPEDKKLTKQLSEYCESGGIVFHDSCDYWRGRSLQLRGQRLAVS